MDGGSQTWFYRGLEAVLALPAHRGSRVDALRAAARSAFALAESLGSASPARASRACRAGCAFCCHYVVRVTAAEALAVADAVRSDAAVRVRLDAYPSRADRARCPLLDDDGRCVAYDARPLACRGWTSTSRDACELEHHDRGGTPLPDAANHHACLGLAAGLVRTAEVAGAPAATYELAAAVRTVLSALDAGTDPLDAFPPPATRG